MLLQIVRELDLPPDSRRARRRLRRGGALVPARHPLRPPGARHRPGAAPPRPGPRGPPRASPRRSRRGSPSAGGAPTGPSRRRLVGRPGLVSRRARPRRRRWPAYAEFARVLRPGGRARGLPVRGHAAAVVRRGRWLFPVMGVVPSSCRPGITDGAIAALRPRRRRLARPRVRVGRARRGGVRQGRPGAAPRGAVAAGPGPLSRGVRRLRRTT